MDKAAASTHLCLKSSGHAPGICRKMKGSGCIVCNQFVFVFCRVEEDMVSTKANFPPPPCVIIWMFMCRPLFFNSVAVHICLTIYTATILLEGRCGSC